MLEDPSYASVVRWGDGQDSFVVLEVGSQIRFQNSDWDIPAEDCRDLEREIHQIHPAQTFQA